MAEYKAHATAAAGRPIAIETRDSTHNTRWPVAPQIIVALIVAAFAFQLVDVDQTANGLLPTVEVDTAGGALPKFDVDTAEVSLGSKSEDITVPTLAVGTTKTDIEVPTISLKKAREKN